MTAKDDTEYIVVMPRIEGNPEVGYEECYYSDSKRFLTLRQVIRHGMNDLCQSDDFLIGKVNGNKLLSLQWMEELRDDRDEVEAAARCLGLSA